MQLTPHFSRKELEASRVATEEKIDNSIPDNMLSKAVRLCEHAERVRDFLGKHYKTEVKMQVTSGYRCPELNAHPRVRGQKTSQHMKLEAIDFIPSVHTPSEVWSVLKYSDLPYDQLILETDRFGSTWIHYSIAPDDRKPRRMAIVLRKK